MFLTGFGSREVGSSFIFTCTVTLSHRARYSYVSILWQGPSTGQQRNFNLAQDTLFVNELTLDPLTLAGDYYCIARYKAGEHATTVRSDVEHVIPISESCVYHEIELLCHFSVPSPSLLLRNYSGWRGDCSLL